MALGAGAVLLLCGGAGVAGALLWANRQVDANQLAGDWITMNVRYTIVVANGTPRVTGVVDQDDGEQMVVESCNWDGATLSWVLFVPSTGSRTKESLYATRTGLALGALNGTYSSAHAQGNGNVGMSVFTRAR